MWVPSLAGRAVSGRPAVRAMSGRVCRCVRQREGVWPSTTVAVCVCAGPQPGCRGPPPCPQAPPGSGWPERCAAEVDVQEPGRALRGGVVGQPLLAAPGRENKSPPSGGGGGCEQSPLWLGLEARQPLRRVGIAGPQPGKRGSPSSAPASACRAPRCCPPCGGGWLDMPWATHTEAIHLRSPGPALCVSWGLQPGGSPWWSWAGLNMGGDGVQGPQAPSPVLPPT